MNSRWFLAGAATAGVIGTGVLSAKASFRVAKDKPKHPSKYYIQTGLVALGTIGCIIGGTYVGEVAQNGLMTLLALAGQSAYERHKKLEEAFVVDDGPITKPVPPRIYPRLKLDQTLYFDTTSGVDDGYFGSTPEEIIIALYQINRTMQIDGEVSYADFYRWLNLPIEPSMYDKGWSIGAGVVYGYEWIDLKKETVTLDDGLECTLLTFRHPPKSDYMSYTPDEGIWQKWE